MPKLEYFVVCREVLSNVVTDEITLSNVLEDIYPEDFPHEIPTSTSVSVWNVDPEDNTDYQATLVVKVPGNKGVEFPMNLAKRRQRYRAMQTVLNIPIDEPGDITFEVLLNGHHEASHVVRIHPVAEAKAEPGISATPK